MPRMEEGKRVYDVICSYEYIYIYIYDIFIYYIV